SGNPEITGAHSRHPDFYNSESGVVYEPTGTVVEGRPFEAKVRYDGKYKRTNSTVFPDNWDAEKITSEVEQIVKKQVPNIPGGHDFSGQSTEGFTIEGHANVKANGKITISTAYPIIK
ncbi:EndoU domain-containing protein, partial [Enterococcus mundtii]